MIRFKLRTVVFSSSPVRVRLAAVALPCAAVLAFTLAVFAQQAAPANPAPAAAQPDAAQQPASAQPDAAQQPANPQAAPDQSAPAPAPTPAPDAATPPESAAAAPPAQKSSLTPGAEPPGGITEDELKQMLVGKQLFLRGGYLLDSLSYDIHGRLVGHSALASYTLCGVEIARVRLAKHKVELEGARYGLHFLGALAYEDPTKALDWVKITPKKKLVRITIDRELVIRPKKVKVEKPAKGASKKSAAGATGSARTEPGTTVNPEPAAAAGTTAEASTPAEASPGAAAKPESAASTPASAGAPAEAPETSDADQLKAEMAATPPEDRPADMKSMTTTTSPAHAKEILKQALDNVFATGLDDRMLAAMPDFWKLYYQAAAAKTDYRPADPAVLRQTTVDQKARLMSKFEPESNEYAQANGVAGMALYHAVIGADGKPGEIAVARPIGFGLDENAVNAILKANFEPAMKDGKPVPVLLDLVVQFRIYSKRTAVSGTPEDTNKQAILPGPYTAQEHGLLIGSEAKPVTGSEAQPAH